MHYIYRITNLINGHTYIGQHKPRSLAERNRYFGSGKLIRQAISKYGIDNFKKEILHDNLEGQEMTNKLERYWISYERLCGRAQYNIADGGIDEHCLFKGHHHTEASKKKISEGSKKAAERYGDNHWNKGRIKTKEEREALSKAAKGKKQWWAYKRTRSAIGNTNTLGAKWYNNGISNIRVKDGQEIPDGFVPGRTYHKRENKWKK